MIGQKIGRYRVVSLLGRGGMGVVYKARDDQLGRWVAVKCLPTDDSGDPRRRERLLHEARAASALNHPNIITIHDISRGDGQDYVVMEYLQGRPLNRVLDGKPLPSGDLLRWAGQIASAVAAAHAAGIVHRDLKPANVLITESGTAKVLDFGLAKSAPSPEGARSDDDATQTAALTRTGAIVGTPAYMSPEQALGRPVDARSDIFSFGVMLYEMATGRRPFEGGNATAIIQALTYGTPVRPGVRAPGIAPGLELAITRALEKDPDRRFQTMGEVADALARVGRNAGGLQIADRLRATALRVGPRRAIAAAVLLFGVGLVVVPATRQAVLRPLRGWIAPGPAALTTQEKLDRATALLESYDLAGHIDEAITLLEDVLSDRRGGAAESALMTEAYWRKYLATQDSTWLDRADTAADQAVAANPLLSSARIARATVLLGRHRFDEALTLLDSVIEDDPLNAAAHLGKAIVLDDLDRTDQAVAAFQEAIRLDPDGWEARLLLGTLHFDHGDYERARGLYADVVRLHPDGVIGYQNLGAAYQALGKFPEAAREYQRALQIEPNAAIFSNLGTAYYYQGAFTEAASAYHKALQLGPGSYVRWANLGDALRQVPGRRNDALAAYGRAAELLREKIEAEPEDVGLRSRAALYLAKAGRGPEAIAEMRSVERQGIDRPADLYRGALTYELAGDRDAALRLLESALEAGFSRDIVNKEADLAPLREDLRFHQILLRLAANGS